MVWCDKKIGCYVVTNYCQLCLRKSRPWKSSCWIQFPSQNQVLQNKPTSLTSTIKHKLQSPSSTGAGFLGLSRFFFFLSSCISISSSSDFVTIARSAATCCKLLPSSGVSEHSSSDTSTNSPLATRSAMWANKLPATNNKGVQLVRPYAKQ